MEFKGLISCSQGLQSTLPEKRAAAERAKALMDTLSVQASKVHDLEARQAEHREPTGPESLMQGHVHDTVTRFTQLQEALQVRVLCSPHGNLPQFCINQGGF